VTIFSLVRDIAECFREAGIADAEREAEDLVCWASGITKSAFHAGTFSLSEEKLTQIFQFAARRLKGEPFHYIVGTLQFMDISVAVGPGVLIPRPETELLVEEAIRLLKQYDRNRRAARDLLTAEGDQPSDSITILDLCTGSGCIALSLAKAFSDASVWGVDLSPRALDYAKKNAQINAISNVTFLQGDLFTPVTGCRFHCITANPPYIKSEDISRLQVEIRCHEPIHALDGGLDGLDYYRKIVTSALDYLLPDGMLIMELGAGQADEVMTLARQCGFKKSICKADYAGIPRIFCGQSA
jgi:release factor glutamine methyltransferase